MRNGDEAFRLRGVALAEYDLGHPVESRQALEALAARHGDEAAYDVAAVHAWRGEPDEAFARLERAHAQRDAALSELRVDPVLRRLRGDPRHAALCRRLNLPAE